MQRSKTYLNNHNSLWAQNMQLITQPIALFKVRKSNRQEYVSEVRFKPSMFLYFINIEDKERSRFRVTPFDSDNYLSWSQEMDVNLRVNVLRKYDKSWSSETSNTGVKRHENEHSQEYWAEEIKEKEAQKRHLALALYDDCR